MNLCKIIKYNFNIVLLNPTIIMAILSYTICNSKYRQVFYENSACLQLMCHDKIISFRSRYKFYFLGLVFVKKKNIFVKNNNYYIKAVIMVFIK